MNPDTPHRHRPPARARQGQTLIFLVMVLSLLAFVALWSFDVHKILSVKLRARTGGDAAALAAARWQGESLNLIGELNVLQALSLSAALARGETNFPEAEALADLAARLCYVGPMLGLCAAQQAAKQNGLYVNAEATLALQLHAAEVRAGYPEAFRIPPYRNLPSPPTCWDDYAGMIEAAALAGIAAAPDNALYYTDFTSRDHLLLDPAFYDAVGSLDWCWFFFHAYDWLHRYGSWRDWPALPLATDTRPSNAEFFSLKLDRLSLLSALPLTPGHGAGSLDDLLARLAALADGAAVDPAVAQVPTTWTCYNPAQWTTWQQLLPEAFPFRAPIQPQYDYAGADAAVRIETSTQRLTPGARTDAIVWTAAAKPFGALAGPVPPHRYGLVLPAFTDVRLVPVDASSATAGGTRPGWSDHIHLHLPPYSQRGPALLSSGCWYCQQLGAWESYAFRHAGLGWLQTNSASCRVTGPGPGGPGGGARRGH